jgi:hypothetical protein
MYGDSETRIDTYVYYNVAPIKLQICNVRDILRDRNTNTSILIGDGSRGDYISPTSSAVVSPPLAPHVPLQMYNYRLETSADQASPTSSSANIHEISGDEF